MSTLAVAFGALSSGFPDGASGSLIALDLGGADLVAGLGLFVVCTVGVLVVRRLQAAGGNLPVPASSSDVGGRELREAA